MVRSIVALMALAVCGVASADRRTFLISCGNDECFGMDQFIAEQPTLEPGSNAKVTFSGMYLADLEGSFFDDTAHFVAAGWGGQSIDVPIRNDVNWNVYGEYIRGVKKWGDGWNLPEDAPPRNTVNIEELNAVRNDFGNPFRADGDVTYDGQIDIADLNMVRNYFGYTGKWSWFADTQEFCAYSMDCPRVDRRAVPEPSAALLLVIAAFALSTHRCRFLR